MGFFYLILLNISKEDKMIKSNQKGTNQNKNIKEYNKSKVKYQKE